MSVMKPHTIWQGGVPACFAPGQEPPQRPTSRKAAPKAGRLWTARPWTTKELEMVRQRYPHEGSVQLSAEMGRTQGAVRDAARNMGLHVTKAQRSAAGKLYGAMASRSKASRTKALAQMMPIDECSPEIELEFLAHEARKRATQRRLAKTAGAWWRRVNKPQVEAAV